MRNALYPELMIGSYISIRAKVAVGIGGPESGCTERTSITAYSGVTSVTRAANSSDMRARYPENLLLSTADKIRFLTGQRHGDGSGYASLFL